MPSAAPRPPVDDLDRLVSQVAAERRLDQEQLRVALLDDAAFCLLCRREQELRANPARGEAQRGLLRIGFLMAEAADRVARRLAAS